MKKIFLFFGVILGVCLLTNSFSEAKTPQDRLKDAYDKSHNIQQEPYSSKLEADDMFQTSNQLSIGGPNAGV